MKRDMDLVIKILEYFEERKDTSLVKRFDNMISGYDKDVVIYHVHRMHEAGLLNSEIMTYDNKSSGRLARVYPAGLTWQGHEFIDAMRGKGVAEKVRQKLGDSLSKVPFTLIKELALSYFRQQIGV